VNTIPPFLKSGDTIAIIATARKILKEEIRPAKELFESWGLKVVISQDLFEVENQFAGTDDKRAQQLQWAIQHPDAKAIFCARGGYGTMRILEKVYFSQLTANPKWIFGFSDITALHCHLLALEHVASVHSPMCSTIPDSSPESIQSIKDVMFGNGVNYKINSHILNKFGDTEGELVGGNLSLLYALKGTQHFPDLAGKILFIEDLDEYLYHIDRMMLSLKMSGLLSRIKGLIVGGFTDMKDNTVPFGKSAEEIILEHVSSYNYPVCFGFPVGHIKDNRALMMGVNGKLCVGSNGVSYSQG
jgi:muramoyltetrapeptide carboxypeptidase